MTDRVGQAWEFSDGLIILVIASNPAPRHIGVTLHDAMILSTDKNELLAYAPADVVQEWTEGPLDRNWEHEERKGFRWRIG